MTSSLPAAHPAPLPAPALARALACALLCAPAGCLFADDAPSDALISCDVSADCPSGWTCSAALGRCILESGEDRSAPELVRVALDREIGTVGDVFRFSFEVNEPLGVSPTARVVADEVARPLTLVEEKSTAFVMAYTVNGTEPQGVFVVQIDLVDTAGNASTGATLGTVELDFTQAAVRLAAPSPSAIRPGGPPSVALLEFSELVREDFEVVMQRDGEAEVPWQIEPLSTANDGVAFAASHVAGGEAEGEWAVVLRGVVDAAGNASEPFFVGVVFVDRTAPIVLVERSSVTPGRLGLQGLIQARVTFSEVLAELPQVVAATAAGGTILAPTIELGDVVQYGFVPTEAGTWSVVVGAGGRDAAGNELVGETVIGSFEVDDDPPGLSSITTNGTAFQGSDTLIVELTADELLAEPPLVDLGGVPLALEPGALSPPSYRYRLPLAGTGLEGDMVLAVRMSDLVGKQAVYDDIIIRVDSRAPRLVSAFLSPSFVANGVTAILSVTLDEPVAAGASPVPIFEPDPGFGFARREGTTYLFTLPITPSIASGTYVLRRVEVRDDAGNEGSLPIDGIALVVDSEPPVILSAQLDAARYSDKPGHDIVRLTLLTDAPAAQIGADIGSSAMSCVDDQPGMVLCTYRVTGTEAEGTNAILVQARDEANNTTFVSVPLELDFTPPALVLVDLIPNPARAGATAFLTLGVNEALRAVPTIELHAPAPSTETIRFALIGEPAASSLVFIFQHSIVDDSDGSYQMAPVRLTDRVGNFIDVDPQRSFTVDTRAPALIGELTSTTTNNDASPAARAGDEVRVVVALDEEPAAPPVVLLGGTRLQPNGPASTQTRFVYDYRVTGSEEEGPQTITMLASDEAGNFSVALLPAAQFDFTPPALDGEVIVRYGAPPGVPMASAATALTNGGSLLVEFRADERLRALPTASVGGAALAVSAGSDPLQHRATFLTVGLLPVADGAHPILFRMEDRVGNAGSYAVDAVVVDTVGPTPLDVGKDGVLIVDRVPFGGDRGDEAGRPITRLLLAPGATLPPNHTLVAWSRANFQDEPLAVSSTGPLGRPDAIVLAPRDLRRVFVSLVDGAGNVDVAVPAKVRRAEWTATMRGKVPNSQASNPHRYDVRRLMSDALTEPFSTEVGGSAVELTDRITLTTTGDGEFQQVRFVDPPSPRHRHAMAFDEVAGGLVLFGGCTVADGCLNDETWRHDGQSWHLVPRIDLEGDGEPSGRAGHGMAYSRQLGAVVLFGGETAFGASQETWAWQGASWKRLFPDGSPPARIDHAMSSLPDGTIALHGGLVAGIAAADTWQFGEETWRPLEGPSPPARSRHAMALDAPRNRAVLFGGLDADGAALGDTWALDGSLWVLVSDGKGPTDPPARSGHSMAPTNFFAGPVVILTGGQNGQGTLLGETFALASGWSPLTLSIAPEARAGHAMAFDPFRGEAMQFGGQTSLGATDETWSFRDEWRRRDPPGTSTPPPRDGAACATIGDRLLVVGGRSSANSPLGDFWTWDGVVWKERQDDAPTARERAAIASDGARAVLVGGLAGGTLLADTWIFEADRWQEVTTRFLTPRVGAALFHAEDRLLLFGGFTGTPSDETFELRGDEWVKLTLDGPPASAAPLVTSLRADGEAIAFIEGETWRFKAGSWSRLITNDPEGDGDPAARTGASLIADRDHGVLWLFGGAIGNSRTDELWSFRVATNSWRRRSPVDLLGDGGPSPRDRACAGILSEDVFVFGGSPSVSTRSDETWRFIVGSSTPAAQVMTVDLRDVLADGATVGDALFTVHAGGRSPTGAGVRLWGFSNGWVPLGDSLSGTPTRLSADIIGADRFITGVSLGLATSTLFGNADDVCELEVDSVEVTLELALTPD
jgi:hypothetical protein